MSDKFIDEGKREHEENEIFIKEFRTTNELLLKERSNLLSELEIKVLSCVAQRTATKRKRPQEFYYPLSSVGETKEAEDLAANHLSRFKNLHMEVLTEREIADKLSDEHLMDLKSKFNNDEPLRGDKDFKVGDKVLLYNSRLKMYPGKHKSKWSGPNIVKMVYPHGAIEITDRDRFSFKVNGQRLKKYNEGNIDKEDDEVIEFENGVT
ncbi:hypothetical protein Tco_0158967 [Tanacetum coccineum]